MARTSTVVQFGLYDLFVKQDGIPSCDDVQPFVQINDLRTGERSFSPLVTFEPDYWSLDGSFRFQQGQHWGLISGTMSGADGKFANPPTLVVDFSVDQSSDWLSLEFSPNTGDYSNHITVEYLTSTQQTLFLSDFYPTGPLFTAEIGVENYRRLVITFHSTNRPYRYLRLASINYGETIIFDDRDIKGAQVIEEIDPSGAELRAGSLELIIHSSSAEFSPLNPDGKYSRLMKGQPISVYEIVDGEQIFIGQFYLDEWQSHSESEIELRCVDLIGRLDTIEALGGLLQGETVQDVLTDLLSRNYVPWEIDPVLGTEILNGWLPPSNLRQAIQQIAFSIGAIVVSSRHGYLHFKPAPIAKYSSEGAAIPKASQGLGTTVTLLPFVSGVTVRSHAYEAETKYQDIFVEDLEAGVHEIVFTEPVKDLLIIGASFLEKGTNYAKINVQNAGTVTIRGKRYRHKQQEITIPDPDPDLVGAVVRAEDATLVNSNNVQEVAQRLYDYYQQRYLVDLKLYAPKESVSQIVDVEVQHGRTVRGVIEKMSIDLAGGMKATVAVVGVLI